MHPFRNKDYSYQTLPTTLSNDDDDNEEESANNNPNENSPQAKAARRDLLERVRRKKRQSLFFLLFFILMTYIILSVMTPGSWLPFDSRTGSDIITMPTFMETSTSSEFNKSVKSPSSPRPLRNNAEVSPASTSGSDRKSSQSHLVAKAFKNNSANADQKQLNDKMACKLPKLDPFEHSIVHLIENPTRPDCVSLFPLLFRSTLNSTLVTVADVKTVFKNVSSCCYKTLGRASHKSDPDNVYSLSTKCFPIRLEKSSVTVVAPDHEFTAIECKFLKSGGTSSTTGKPTAPSTTAKVMDMHAFVPKKPAVEKRIEKYYADLLSRNRDNDQHDGSKSLLEKDRVNVVMLGIDAVSHMNFIRTMPKTHSFLMKTLSAVEMKGFNKVGDNTYPNLGAGLTSLNKSTIEKSCEEDETYDKCPFIWKKYASNGYRTSYGEDSTWMGIFNYLKKGFKSPPTDYYLRPFGVGAEDLIGTFKTYNARLCYGPRLSFEVLLDYMRKFAFSMGHAKRYFQFIWATSLTHDALNYARLGDEQLLSTLKWFLDEGYFNRTVFILMSDHGIRWGSIHEYLQGQLEERLPFLYFVAPTWFRQKYKRAYDNLNLNQNRLTTYYDFHETLVDLIDLRRLDSDVIADKELLLALSDKSNQLPRGISQFLPIPLSRTCETAGIEEHYCTCHHLKEIEKNNSDVNQAANYVVHHINSMVSHHPKCGFLSLAEIKTANVIDFGFNTTKWKAEKGFELTVETSPGKAVFETSVIQNKTGYWRVSGTISRTNLYGNQSHCVDEKDLKLYCYCTDNLL